MIYTAGARFFFVSKTHLAGVDMRRSSVTSNERSGSFKLYSLRAPIFGKNAPEKVDLKANQKYCSDEIVKSWFKVIDVDGSGDITFEEYRKSALGSQLPEKTARENFARMDLDGNNTVNFQELKAYHEKVGLPDLQPDQSLLIPSNEAFFPPFSTPIRTPPHIVPINSSSLAGHVEGIPY